MIRLPPISNRMTPSFPTRLSSDLGDDHQAPCEQQHHDRQEIVEKACVSDHLARLVEERPRCLEPGACTSAGLERSEEHTSELQSLLRTSYAVFCLITKRRHHLATCVAPVHTYDMSMSVDTT